MRLVLLSWVVPVSVIGLALAFCAGSAGPWGWSVSRGSSGSECQRGWSQGVCRGQSVGTGVEGLFLEVNSIGAVTGFVANVGAEGLLAAKSSVFECQVQADHDGRLTGTSD